MKKVRYISVLCLVAIMLSLSLTANAALCPHGYYTFGDYIMNGGVGGYGSYSRYYWIDTNLASTYQTQVRNAVSEWVYTTSAGIGTTSISILEATTRGDAMFEFIQNTSLGTGVLGLTQFYLYQNEVSLISSGILPSNYGWSRCSLNTSSTALGSLTTANRKGTIAHEMGHALGLAHRNSTATSIMCQYGSGRTATRASTSDLNSINHLYG